MPKRQGWLGVPEQSAELNNTGPSSATRLASSVLGGK